METIAKFLQKDCKAKQQESLLVRLCLSCHIYAERTTLALCIGYLFKETSIMTCKALKRDLGPTFPNDLLQNISKVHSGELRNNATDFHVPWRKSCNGQKFLFYRGAKI